MNGGHQGILVVVGCQLLNPHDRLDELLLVLHEVAYHFEYLLHRLVVFPDLSHFLFLVLSGDVLHLLIHLLHLFLFSLGIVQIKLVVRLQFRHLFC